jgi:hypothetical protein
MTQMNVRNGSHASLLLRFFFVIVAAGGSVLLAPVAAVADEPALPPAPEASPAQPPAATPLPPQPPPPAPPPAASPPAPPAPAVTPPPAPPPPWGPDPKNVQVGAWFRLGGRIQNPSARDQLNDFWMDEIYLILAANGRITPWFKWQIGLNALNPVPPVVAGSNLGPVGTAYPSVGIQDLIAKLEFDPVFNLWVGRLLVPGDRSNLSGPWFINYETYPGFLRIKNGGPIGIKTGQNGRDQGATVWGTAAAGMFKYYLGAYNLDSTVHDVNPLITTRLVLNLVDPEPGYYNQSAYHGAKDILAIGASLQYQKSGSTRTITPPMGTTPGVYDVGDFHTYEVDVLADKNLGTAGVGELEGGFYSYDQRQPVRQFYMFGGGYVLPQPVGPGRFEPAIRYQFTETPNVKMFDGIVNYLLQSHFAKFYAGFYWADMTALGAGKQKAFQFGIQVIRL